MKNFNEHIYRQAAIDGYVKGASRASVAQFGSPKKLLFIWLCFCSLCFGAALLWTCSVPVEARSAVLFSPADGFEAINLQRTVRAVISLSNDYQIYAQSGKTITLKIEQTGAEYDCEIVSFEPLGGISSTPVRNLEDHTGDGVRAIHAVCSPMMSSNFDDKTFDGEPQATLVRLGRLRAITLIPVLNEFLR